MNTNEIINKLGIKLNDMQQAACKAIAGGNGDVVILSPTGTGKTYAYLIPLAARIDAESDELQAVVLMPGRELALQSANVLKAMGTGLRTMALYGGRPTMEEHRKLREIRPQIVFATPGRLNDHIDKGNIAVDSVSTLVIDEFDKMLQMGFQDEMSQIIAKLSFTERHILLSATDAEEIPAYLRDGFKPLRLDFLPKDGTNGERVNIFKVESPGKDKLDTLSKLLVKLGNESSIVFLNYRDSVERTASYLKEEGFTVSMFHGGLDQASREHSLYLFSNGTANILVCTDLASRGLDIPNIDNIIHYHLPEGEDAYIHRVGRTARWNKHGRTFFILSPEEKIPEYVSCPSESSAAPAISEYKVDEDDGSVSPASENMKQGVIPQPKMSTIYIGKGKKDKISKGDIVGFLCKKGGLRGDDIGQIDVFERYSYAAVPREKLRQVLKLTRNEKIKGQKTITEEVTLGF